jgi:hypothetical protein
MALRSQLFAGDRRLEAAAVSDPAHVTPGATGDHVGKIQTALRLLDDATIASAEIDALRYGPTTTAAVLAYKRARNIINPAYETAADNIVGKMTIAALDEEMLTHEANDATLDPQIASAMLDVIQKLDMLLLPGFVSRSSVFASVPFRYPACIRRAKARSRGSISVVSITWR